MNKMTQLHFKDNLLTKVAWYYYKDGLTQNEIAGILNISRNKVVRLLEKARVEGIVQFNIKGSGLHCLGIERDFIRTFQLTDAFIIPTPKGNVSDSLGKAAAQYLENHLPSNALLGIGWGETVSKTLHDLNLDCPANLSIVTLTGGVNYYFQRQGGQMSQSIAKFKGQIHIIPSPFLGSTDEMSQSILSEPAVKDILHLAALANATIVGIGGLSSEATIIKEEKMTLGEMAFIRNNNGVGDILGQFYDCSGKILNLPHHKRLIGVSLDVLRKMKHVIGVAAGQQKVDAIYGAMKGKYIRTLITDEETAISLLQKEGK